MDDFQLQFEFGYNAENSSLQHIDTDARPCYSLIKKREAIMIESSKALISKLYDMNQGAERCMYLLQNAYIYHSSKSLAECESKTKELRQIAKVMTEELIAEAKADPFLSVYVSVPGHFERMGGFIDAISGCMRTKIKEGLLFSDRAVSEISFLLKRTEEVLQNTGDIILARNIIIREYVKDSAAEISRSANEFATMHEERLIAGVCMSKASPLFLEIMDAIKGITWHAKEIALQLAITGDIRPKKPLAL